MRPWLVLAAISAGALASTLAPARAATFAATTVEEVARAADAVVRGRVAAATARATSEGRIVTDVDIAVTDAWKGAPEPVVRVVVPGGRLPDVAMRVEGAPTFVAGEEVVVFLHRRGAGWNVSGLALGKYRVEDGEAKPASSGAAILPRGAPLPEGERQVGPMPVAELERRVRAAR
jgi:hypothetical protein